MEDIYKATADTNFFRQKKELNKNNSLYYFFNIFTAFDYIILKKWQQQIFTLTFQLHSRE